jgi:hypothetical protein
LRVTTSVTGRIHDHLELHFGKDSSPSTRAATANRSRVGGGSARSGQCLLRAAEHAADPADRPQRRQSVSRLAWPRAIRHQGWSLRSSERPVRRGLGVRRPHTNLTASFNTNRLSAVVDKWSPSLHATSDMPYASHPVFVVPDLPLGRQDLVGIFVDGRSAREASVGQTQGIG